MASSYLDAQAPARRLLLGLLQLLQQLPLGFGQLSRNLDAGGDEQVPMAPSLGRALALQAESLAVGGARWHLHGDRAVQRRDANVGTERGLRVRDGQLERQVVPRTPEERVGLHPDPHIEVPRLRAGGAGLAPAGEPDPGAVLDAGGDLDLEAPRPPAAPGPAARRARRLHDAPRAVADGTGLAHLEQPLIHRDGARPAASRTGRRARARRGAASVTGLARRRAGDPDRHRGSGHRVVERDRHGRLQIRPTGGTGSAAAPPTPEQPAEQVPEIAEVLEADPAGEPTLEPAATARGSTRAEPRRGHVAHLVVLLALVLVAQDVVRRRDLLEPVLGLRVPGVRVGVVLLRELAVGLFDLGRARVLRDAEHLVVVLVEPLASDVAVHGRLRPRSARRGRSPDGSPCRAACTPAGRSPRRADRPRRRRSASGPRARWDRTPCPRRRSARGPRHAASRRASRRRARRPCGTPRSPAAARPRSTRGRTRPTPPGAPARAAGPRRRRAAPGSGSCACGSSRTPPAAAGGDPGTRRPRSGPA